MRGRTTTVSVPRKPKWVERSLTIWLDEGTYGEVPDAEEIAYLLRMGGIDAMATHEEWMDG